MATLLSLSFLLHLLFYALPGKEGEQTGENWGATTAASNPSSTVSTNMVSMQYAPPPATNFLITGGQKQVVREGRLKEEGSQKVKGKVGPSVGVRGGERGC